MGEMNMGENVRVILGLRSAGWDDKKINDFILYVEGKNEKFIFTPDNDKEENTEAS